MARTTTTFTKTAEGKVLYHFICNHCGMRNDKVAQISADAQAAYRGAAYGNMAGSVLDMRLGNQAMNSLNARIAQLGEQICDYGCGLREGRTFRYSLFDNELKGAHPDHIDAALDGVCTHCGKKQAWAMNPTEGTTLIIYLSVASGLLLGFGGLGAAAAIGSGAAATVIGFLGIVFLISGLALIAVLPKRRIKKNQLAIAAEPNDPNKLPVLDAH